jgi:hypothetical protein
MSYKRKRGRRTDATGRSAGEQYVNIGYPMLQSVAWRSLSGPACKVWLELRTRYNGGNNGKLALSLEEAARLLHLGKATVQRAFTELEAKGFVVMSQRGQWYGRKATTWTLCDRSSNGVMATHAWKRWRPNSPAANSSDADPKNVARFPGGPRQGIDGTAGEPNDANTVRLETRRRQITGTDGF